MGQQQGKPSKHFVHNFGQLAELKARPDVLVSGYRLLSEKTLMVATNPRLERSKPFTRGCIFIAAQVTACARINLVKDMESCRQKGLLPAYCDTDSMLLVPLKPNSRDKLKDILRLNPIRMGAWDIEVDSIREFSGLQPKCYEVKITRFSFL